MVNTDGVVKIFNVALSSVKHHTPEILTGVGVVGMISSTVLAVRATPKAIKIIEENKKEKSVDKLEPIDIVKQTWKLYIPSAIIGVASIGCIIGSNSISVRRNAALITAYTISESAAKEYKDTVTEIIPEKKVQEIKEAIAKDHISKDPVESHDIITTGNGNTLCYDILSGRYFYSSADKIRRSVNVINERLLDQSYISLNEFFYELGLEGTKLGEDLGWGISQGLINIDFTTQLSSDDQPCLVIGYDRMPMYDFDKWL